MSVGHFIILYSLHVLNSWLGDILKMSCYNTADFEKVGKGGLLFIQMEFKVTVLCVYFI